MLFPGMSFVGTQNGLWQIYWEDTEKEMHSLLQGNFLEDNAQLAKKGKIKQAVSNC